MDEATPGQDHPGQGQPGQGQPGQGQPGHGAAGQGWDPTWYAAQDQWHGPMWQDAHGQWHSPAWQDAQGHWHTQPWPASAPGWAPAPPPAPRPRRRTGLVLGGLVGGVAAIVGIGLAVNSATAGSGSEQAALPSSGQAGDSGSGQSGSGQSGSGSGNGQSGGSVPQNQAATTGLATAQQQVGVVDIDTVLKYQDARAAATGMILTSSGEVLTNNHVVDGSTSITVTVVSTGRTYSATVVGTDPTADVAVIQLKGASGLQTVKTDSSVPSVGAKVTGVGNAGGAGGTPSAATGQVLATGQTITASDENGSNAETLNDLIETNAPIAAGDSGGPLYDAQGKVVGMDTAASTSGSGGGYGRWQAPQDATANTAYAIPIKDALTVAKRIESGEQSSAIHQGYPGFLGVELQAASSYSATAGAQIADVVAGGPAEAAGLQAGDVITAVNGHQISSADDLSSALSGDRPGEQVSVTWTSSADGQSHTATITLATGPAD